MSMTCAVPYALYRVRLNTRESLLQVEEGVDDHLRMLRVTHHQRLQSRIRSQKRPPASQPLTDLRRGTRKNLRLTCRTWRLKRVVRQLQILVLLCQVRGLTSAQQTRLGKTMRPMTTWIVVFVDSWLQATKSLEMAYPLPLNKNVQWRWLLKIFRTLNKPVRIVMEREAV